MKVRIMDWRDPVVGIVVLQWGSKLKLNPRVINGLVFRAEPNHTRPFMGCAALMPHKSWRLKAAPGQQLLSSLLG